MAVSTAHPVAFVGLGSMGLPMARNLVRHGFPVRGFDVRAEGRSAFAQSGGTPAATIAEVADGAGTLVLMVVNADQAEAVLFGEGALERLSADAAVVLMATCPPASVAALAKRVTATGRAFVDAPSPAGSSAPRPGR